MSQEVNWLKGATSDAGSPRLQHQGSPQAEGQDTKAFLSKKSQCISFTDTSLLSLLSSCSQGGCSSDSLISLRSRISKNKTADMGADKESTAARNESSELTVPTSESPSTPRKAVAMAKGVSPWFREDTQIHQFYAKCDSAGKPALLAKQFGQFAISKEKGRSRKSHLSANIFAPGLRQAALRSPSRYKQGIESNTSTEATMTVYFGGPFLVAAATPRLLPEQVLPEIPEELRQMIPLDEMKRQTSAGSAQHAAGSCVPCAYWFKGVCKNGIHCLHCHFIHEGQRSKRLRPSKQTRMRLRRRAPNEAGAAELASDNHNLHREQDGDSKLATMPKISL